MDAGESCFAIWEQTMTMSNRILKTIASTALVAGIGATSMAANAGQVLSAPTVKSAITLDGQTGDWNSVPGITVALAGEGRVQSVEMKAAVHGDTIYVLAVWNDTTQDILHKPYKWDDAEGKYRRTKQFEDRFAISLKMSGDFSANKIDGSAFEADVWHWKASRSNPAGIAHDKMWKVSKEPFPRAKQFKISNGKTVYLARRSDKGDRLYKPSSYETKQNTVMPRYVVNLSPKGSIADVRAKGVWRDGRWFLELARKLNTGHTDDAVIAAKGTIEIAVAAFNGVDGRRHSVSEKMMLRTGGRGMRQQTQQ